MKQVDFDSIVADWQQGDVLEVDLLRGNGWERSGNMYPRKSLNHKNLNYRIKPREPKNNRYMDLMAVWKYTDFIEEASHEDGPWTETAYAHPSEIPTGSTMVYRVKPEQEKPPLDNMDHIPNLAGFSKEFDYKTSLEGKYVGKKNGKILRQAYKMINGKRNEKYGTFAENIDNMEPLMEALTGNTYTRHELRSFFIALKLCRTNHKKFNTDELRDLAGYCGLIEDDQNEIK